MRHDRMELCWVRAPLAPLTVTSAAVDLDFHAGGNVDGFAYQYETLLYLLSLPDEGEDFAADIQLARLLVGHDALGGGDDSSAEAVQTLGISSQPV